MCLLEKDILLALESRFWTERFKLYYNFARNRKFAENMKVTSFDKIST